MKIRFLCGAALWLGGMITAAAATDFDWPGHGSISIDTPASWRLRGVPAGDTGFNFRGDWDGKSAAMLQITVVALPADKPAPNKIEAKEFLEKMVADALAGSVEKKFSPVALNLREGYGWYAQLTDASLVGQPPQPGNLKIMRNGFASLSAHTMAVITMQFDDPQSAAPAEMLHLVETLRFQGAKAEMLQVQRVGEFYELSVPPNKLRLKIPTNGLTATRANLGGSTANPRYFSFSGGNAGRMVSGWFEPASHYANLLSFWKSEVDGLKRGGQPEPTHVSYGKIGGWETVAYDTAGTGLNNAHLRAELTQAGTWIDLHVSLTGDRPIAELHAELRAFIESLVVENK